jgi:hypothetical protein
MSTRPPPDSTRPASKTGLMRPRLPSLFDDEMDALEVSEAETRVQRQTSIVTVAQRLALRQTLRDLARLADGMPMDRPSAPPPALESGVAEARDSRVTVPPAVASVPPPRPAFPPPAAPTSSGILVDATVQLAPITPAFAAVALEAPASDGPIGRGTWALMIATLAVALLGGLLLGQALTSHPASAGSAGADDFAVTSPGLAADHHSPAMNSTFSRASAALSSAPADSPPAAPVAADPGAPSVPAMTLRAPRPAHHALVHSAPKAAASTSPAGDPAIAAPKGSRPVQTARDSADDPVRRPIPVN